MPFDDNAKRKNHDEKMGANPGRRMHLRQGVQEPAQEQRSHF